MASFGSLLRKARDQKRVSLDDVTRDTRLAKRYLEALESESLNKLPGGAYNRAYLRTYATYLGLDPDALARQYEEEEASQTAAGRLPARPDALATIRQAAAQRRAVPTPMTRAFSSVSGGGGRVAAIAAGVVLLGGLGWLGNARFAAPQVRPMVLRGSTENTVPAGALSTSLQPASGTMRTAPPVPPRSSAEPKTSARRPSTVSAAKREEVQEQRDEPTAPTDAVTKEANAVPVAVQDGAALVVPQSGVGTDVVNRQLVGQSETFDVGTSVVFWTQIVGGQSGDSVSHVWLHNGRTAGVVDLVVGGPSWRTQSRHTLAPDAEGTWVVEARDSDGHVLARQEFRCES